MNCGICRAVVCAIAMLWGIQLQAQLQAPASYGAQQSSLFVWELKQSMIQHARYELTSAVTAYSTNALEDKSAVESILADIAARNFSLALDKSHSFLERRSNSPFVPSVTFAIASMNYDLWQQQNSITFFDSTAKRCTLDFEKRKDSSYILLRHKALFYQGIQLFQLGRYEEAEPVLELCSSELPTALFADDALLALGFIAESKSLYARALAYYYQIDEEFPKRNVSVVAKMRSAQNNLMLREAKTAITIIESAQQVVDHIAAEDSIGASYQVQSMPVDTRSQLKFLRGEALNQTGQFEQAYVQFSDIIATSSSSSLKNQARLDAGWALLHLGKNNQALTFYNEVLDSVTEPNSRIRAMAQLYKAVALKRLSQRENAIKELVAITSQTGYAFSASALLELGEMYYEDGKFDNARRAFEKAERESNDPLTSARVNLFLGATYVEQQQWQKAIKCYQNAEIIAIKNNATILPQRLDFIKEATLKRGIAYAQNLQYREAISDLTNFIGMNEDGMRSDEALFWLSESYYRTDLLQNALDSYGKLITQYAASKRREESLYGLGWSNFRLRNFDKAADIFAQMIEEFPKSKFAAEVLARKGDALYLQKRYIPAAQAYKEASKRSPKSEEGQYASYQLGQSLYRATEYTNAVTAFRQFIKNFPQSPLADDALYTIAWINYYQQKFSSAIDEFLVLTKTYPQSSLVPQSLYYIGDCYFNSEDYEKAIFYYKKVNSDFPSSPYSAFAIRGLQYTYINLGQNEEAIKVAKEFVNANPNSTLNQDIDLSTGDIFYSGKSFKSAIQEYSDFLKKYPDGERTPEALFRMAKSYQSLNDSKNAEETYSSLLKKFPTSEFAGQSLLEIALIAKQSIDIARADSLFNEVQTKFSGSDPASRAGYERAELALKRNDTTTAMNMYLQVATTTKGEYADQSRYQLGMYLRSINLYDSARSIFAPLVLSEDNPMLAAEAQFRIGDMYAREDNCPKAIEAFAVVKDRFDKMEDWFTLSLIGLGECYEKQKEFEKAREIFQTIVMLHPNDDYGKSAQAKIKRLGKY